MSVGTEYLADFITQEVYLGEERKFPAGAAAGLGSIKYGKNTPAHRTFSCAFRRLLAFESFSLPRSTQSKVDSIMWPGSEVKTVWSFREQLCSRKRSTCSGLPF